MALILVMKCVNNALLKTLFFQQKMEVFTSQNLSKSEHYNQNGLEGNH